MPFSFVRIGGLNSFFLVPRRRRLGVVPGRRPALRHGFFLRASMRLRGCPRRSRLRSRRRAPRPSSNLRTRPATRRSEAPVNSGEKGARGRRPRARERSRASPSLFAGVRQLPSPHMRSGRKADSASQEVLDPPCLDARVLDGRRQLQSTPRRACCTPESCRCSRCTARPEKNRVWSAPLGP